MLKKALILSLWILSPQALFAGCIPTCIQQGPNRLQPAPVLTSATNSDGVITIKGNLSSIRRNATYIIQFFGNPANRGVTEGDNFLGQITLTTNCLGLAPFNAVLLPPTQNTDPFVSATATLVLCDGTLSDTSEFSASIPMVIS